MKLYPGNASRSLPIVSGRRTSRRGRDFGFCLPRLLLVSFLKDKQQETVLVVSHVILNRSEVVRGNSQVAPFTPSVWFATQADSFYGCFE